MVLDHAQDRAVSDAKRYLSDAPRKFAKRVAVVKSFLETLFLKARNLSDLMDFWISASLIQSKALTEAFHF